MKAAKRVAVVALFVCAAAVTARAQTFDINQARARYTVTVWTEKEGMPSSYVRAIAQDANGYLWLATYSGLVRFDGIRFVKWSPASGASPGEDLSAILVARDGSIWVGGVVGGITRISNGQVSNYRSAPRVPEGMFEGYVSDLLEDNDGVIWAAVQGGLARFDGARWERIGPENGLPMQPATSLHQDAHGTLIVRLRNGLFARPRGQTRFEPYSPLVQTDRLKSASFVDQLGGFVPLDGGGNFNGQDGSRLLRDQRGYLWVGTRGSGLMRIRGELSPAGPTVEHLNREDGLSADSILALFEDRESNIWVGTPFGLNRLSENPVIPVFTRPSPSSYISAVAATADGSIWAASSEGLLQFSGNTRRTYGATEGLSSVMISSLYADRRTQDLWIANDRGLFRMSADRITEFTLPHGLRLTHIRSITSDINGNLWLCDGDRGVFHSQDPTLSAFDLVMDDKPASSVYAGADGRVWIGLVNGTVRMYRDGVLKSYGADDGLSGGGTITAIHEDHNGTVWIGTHDGLSRFRDGHFAALTKDNQFPGTGPVGIASDDQGNLWLGLTSLGIVRMGADEFEAAAIDKHHPLRYKLFGISDGLRASPVRWGGTPTVARGTDGTIWFITGNGLAIVDPTRLRGANRSPVLLIEDVTADSRNVDLATGVILPPLTASFHISYTLETLLPLSQATFRYKLEGFDHQWVEAERRREAFYTNVPPGRYLFKVEASSEDGSLRSATALPLSIQPTFYQTSWFAFARIAAVVLVLWGLWQLRVRQIKNRFAVVLSERARMGREIHDTLLQGLVGVAMQFKVIGDHLQSSPELAKERLERARNLVEHYIAETRQSIWDLRSPAFEATDLGTALRAAGEAITADKPVHFELAISGKPRPFPPKMAEQLLRVGREAITNAVRHAQPSRVRVELVYDDRTVRLEVSDDGNGFDAEDPEFSRATHWGLASMRERAEQINGQFQLWSRPGAGTRLELTVPLTGTQ